MKVKIIKINNIMTISYIDFTIFEDINSLDLKDKLYI